MRRYLLFFLIISVIFGLQVLISCSQPLDGITGSQASSDDTGDPGGVIDTTETPAVFDTTYCGHLGPHHREIEWTLENPEGDYNLEIHVETEHPRCHSYNYRILRLDIDGVEFGFEVIDDEVNFELDSYLEQNATIRITTSHYNDHDDDDDHDHGDDDDDDEEHGHEHTLDICMRVTSESNSN